MSIVGWRIVEDDGSIIEPFGTAQLAKDAAERRANDRGHRLVWADYAIPPHSRGIPDDAGPWVRGCKVEPIYGEEPEQ